MSKSSILGLGGIFMSAVAIAGSYMYTYDETEAAEPVAITIESKSLGLNAQADVQKVYEVRKEKLTDKLNTIKKSASKEDAETLTYAYDSVECMDKSMEQYPKLIEVINGAEKSAEDIYKDMEGNCVEDVLFYLKSNYPEKFVVVHKAVLDAGFIVPAVED